MAEDDLKVGFYKMETLKVKKNNIEFIVEDSKKLKQDANYKFWLNEYSSWENYTFNILDKYLNLDKDFLDIGAWVGPTSIYSSFLCRNVIAIEPDPVAYDILNRNIKLNEIKNITTINKAATKQKESYMKSIGFYGDSMTRVDHSYTSGTKVYGVGLDSLLEMGEFSLIKIDIEGHEFELMPDYANEIIASKIPVLVSMHYPFVDDKENKLISLIEVFKSAKVILDESEKEIDIDNIVPGFGSYLLIW